MKTYPEIEKLKSLYAAKNISLKRILPTSKDGFVYVEMSTKTKSWNIFVDDEYEDCTKKNPLVALFLILSSLEIYHDSLDFLDWCHQSLLDASDITWLTYYKSLEKTYEEIKHEFGEIDSCISSLDYQLRTGIIDALFECDV